MPSHPPAPARRVLLLLSTTTYRANAFLQAAEKLRLEAVVGSEREQVLAPSNPVGNLTLDFSDPGEAARAILEFAAWRPLGAVIAADDEGAMTAALAAEQLGLEHHSARGVAATRDKFRMRQTVAEAGMSTPGFRQVGIDENPSAIARQLRFPCVVKPLSLSASRGVIRADDEPSFVAAFERAADLLRRLGLRRSAVESDRALLIEDYLPGAEVALEGLVTRGRLRVLALFDKPDPLEGPFFEETIYVTPSRQPEEAQVRAARCAQEAVTALGLNHGPVHAELRIEGNHVSLVEIAARSIGGLCSRALRFGDGISLEELLLRHALGEDVGGLERESRASGVMMIPIPRRGILRGIEGIDGARDLPGMDDVRITIPIGQEVVPLPEGARYLGFLFASADSPAEVESTLHQAHGRLRFAIDDALSQGPTRE